MNLLTNMGPIYFRGIELVFEKAVDEPGFSSAYAPRRPPSASSSPGMRSAQLEDHVGSLRQLNIYRLALVRMEDSFIVSWVQVRHLCSTN